MEILGAYRDQNTNFEPGSRTGSQRKKVVKVEDSRWYEVQVPAREFGVNEANATCRVEKDVARRQAETTTQTSLSINA